MRLNVRKQRMRLSKKTISWQGCPLRSTKELIEGGRELLSRFIARCQRAVLTRMHVHIHAWRGVFPPLNAEFPDRVILIHYALITPLHLFPSSTCALLSSTLSTIPHSLASSAPMKKSLSITLPISSRLLSTVKCLL